MSAPALTMLPPWSWAIVHAGKRLENRDWRRGCSYRGPVWLHTSNAPTGSPEAVLRSQSVAALDYMDAVETMVRTAVDTLADTGPITHGALLATRGMILGRANVVGVVERAPNVDRGDFDWMVFREPGQGVPREMTGVEKAWWTGGFALVLDDVVALPEPVACKGALGFWPVPEDIEAKCLAQVTP